MKTLINAAEALGYINTAEQELANASNALREIGIKVKDLSTHWRATTGSELYNQYEKVAETLRDAIKTMSGYTETNKGIVQLINNGLVGTGVQISLTSGAYASKSDDFTPQSYTDKIGIEDGQAVIDVINSQVSQIGKLQVNFTGAVTNYKRLWSCANEAGNGDVAGSAHGMAESIRGIATDFQSALSSYTSTISKGLSEIEESVVNQKQLTDDQVKDLTSKLGRAYERLSGIPSEDKSPLIND